MTYINAGILEIVARDYRHYRYDVINALVLRKSLCATSPATMIKIVNKQRPGVVIIVFKSR